MKVFVVLILLKFKLYLFFSLEFVICLWDSASHPAGYYIIHIYAGYCLYKNLDISEFGNTPGTSKLKLLVVIREVNILFSHFQYLSHIGYH